MCFESGGGHNVLVLDGEKAFAVLSTFMAVPPIEKENHYSRRCEHTIFVYCKEFKGN